MSEKGDENAAKLASYAEQLAASKSATAKAEAEALRQKLAVRGKLKDEIERRREEVRQLFKKKSGVEFMKDFSAMMAETESQDQRVEICRTFLECLEGTPETEATRQIKNKLKEVIADHDQPAIVDDIDNVSQYLKRRAQIAAKILSAFSDARKAWLKNERMPTAVGLEILNSIVPRHTEAVRALVESDPALFKQFQNRPDEINGLIFLGLWADGGMPVFSLTESLLATLILSDPPPLNHDRLLFPFPMFDIVIPGRFMDVLLVSVTRFKKEGVDTLMFSLNLTEGRTFGENMPFNELPEQFTNLHTNFAWRLIRNLLAWIEASPPKDPEGLKKGEKYRPRTIRRDRQGNAAPTTWVLGREVKLGPELRRMAAEYAVGESERTPGWKVGVRYVVRGHWKMQPHGPGRTERKRIFIEPYWKGPEGAAAFSHVYKLTEEEK